MEALLRQVTLELMETVVKEGIESDVVKVKTEKRMNINEVTQKALDEAKIPDLEEYMRERTFVFLHHFSGPEDRLSIAIQREAARGESEDDFDRSTSRR